jgi:hypothetical protein
MLTLSLLYLTDQTKGYDTSSSGWGTMGTTPSRVEHNISQPGNCTQIHRRGRMSHSTLSTFQVGPSVVMRHRCHFVILLSYVLILYMYSVTGCYFNISFTYVSWNSANELAYFVTVRFLMLDIYIYIFWC